MTREKTATAQEFAKLYDERKQARELCDELATLVRVLKQDGINSEMVDVVDAVLGRYEARPWRYSG